MRRRRFRRILALPLTFWFVALSVNLGGYCLCPMDHDMGPGGAMGAMAMGGQQSPLPNNDAAPHCTGVCCCCSALMTLPSAAVTLPGLAGAPAHDAAPVEPRAVPNAAPQILLPPANGPPALHTV